MANFCDNTGTQWDLSLTLGTVDRIRKALNIDLLDLEAGDPPLAVRLATDGILIAEITHQTLLPAMQAAGITADDFKERIGPKNLADLFAAYAQELIDFFRLSGRPDRAAALENCFRAVAVTAARAKTQIETIPLNSIVDHALASCLPGSKAAGS